MNRTTILASAIGASVATITGLAWYLRRSPEAELHGNVIALVSPIITVSLAEEVLSRMEHLPPDEVTLVLHTEGGEITACILIANALRKFKNSTAIVPYMAFSGGTMIALNATNLLLGKNAALSAVDPIVYGLRARHVPERAENEKNPLHPLAQEYDSAVDQYLRESLASRLRGVGGPAALERAMSVFMGQGVPHAWPIYATRLRELGVPVEAAGAEWSRFVDAYRRRFPPPRLMLLGATGRQR
jgi:hypothetical protein